MIAELLKDWKGEIEINDKTYTIAELSKIASKTFSDQIHIKLHSAHKNVSQSITERENSIIEYRITVKKYMTMQATPEFDFMSKWNNDIPMPLRTMTGTVEKETRGMIYMKLHGQAEPVIKCMRCGKTLTNPISQHYGIGPECMSKLGLICDITDVDTIKKKLVDVTWEGWIVKSAITEREEVKC